jgi:hypothetical protein
MTKLAWRLLEIGGECCPANTDHRDPTTTFRVPAIVRTYEC